MERDCAMDKFVELEYLREVNRKYGHYLKKYFGFSLKDIADYMGISKSMFTLILQEKRKMQDKYRQRFIEAFKRFNIEEKTKDFKESDMQLMIKGAWRKIRLDRRGLISIMVVAMATWPFLNNKAVNALYCIRPLVRNSCNLLKNFKAIVVFLFTIAFLFLVRRTTKLQNLPNQKRLGFLF